MTQAFNHLRKGRRRRLLVQNLAGCQLSAGLKDVLEHHARASAAVLLFVVFRLQKHADWLMQIREQGSVFLHFPLGVVVPLRDLAWDRFDAAQLHTGHDRHQRVISLVMLTVRTGGVDRKVGLLAGCALEDEGDAAPALLGLDVLSLEELANILAEFFDGGACGVCVACCVNV